MTRTDRKETKVLTPEETKQTNSVLTDIISSATKESQEMLQGMNRSVREVTYNFDNPLEIPVELEDRFKGEGYELRWIRFMLDGAHDVKNIQRRIRQGFTLVTRGEAKELSVGLIGSSDAEFVIVDDSVLAKITKENRDLLKGQLAYKAKHQEEGIRAEFREQAVRNKINVGNIRDNSHSSVSGGPKKRNFAEG